MSATADDKPQRISPAITFKFEELAFRICDEGKVDFYERPYRIRDLTLLMEESFRAKIADGRIQDDEAVQRVMETHGSEYAIKMRRGGWKGLCHRLLYHQSYSFHRLATIALFCLSHYWLTGSNTPESTEFPTSRLPFVPVIYRWNYSLGAFLLVAILVPQKIARTLEMRTVIGQKVSMALTLALFAQIAYEWIHSGSTLLLSYEHFSRVGNITPYEHFWAVCLLGCYLIEVAAFFLMLVLATAQIFDFPTRRRTRIAEKRKAKNLR